MLLVPLHQLSQGEELLLGDVYRLIQDDPRGGLVAGRHRCGAVVRHVIFRVRQELPHRELLNLHRLASVSDLIQLFSEYS